MRKRKSTVIILLIALLAVVIAGCGTTAKLAETVSPTPEPTPEPTPAPTPEPVFTASGQVTVDGIGISSGSFMCEDIQYVKFAEAIAALGSEVEESEDGSVIFLWYGKTVVLVQDSTEMLVGEECVELSAPVLLKDEELYVPVKDFCLALDISLFYDEEYSHLYCTPGAGDWELKEGYTVPVLMYHSVSDYIWGESELFVSPSRMEEQLAYLVENGYDPIWFEDLREIEKYDKPVILTFDDGWEDNYTELLPLLEKYNVKATFFIITSMLERQYHGMNTEQLLEVADSGLVSIQSHTVSHRELGDLSYERQQSELERSKLELTRLVGKEPFVLCYPRGVAYQNAMELTPMYYRFGVKMGGDVYKTGDDPILIYRYYISRHYTIDGFVELMEGIF